MTMKRLMIAGGLLLAGVLLNGCETMSEDQCLAGAWGERGYQDGLEGYTPARLDEHAEACAQYGVAPDPVAYASAREDGLRRYCTYTNAFQVGRRGETYRQVCRPEEELAFLPAYSDGRRLHEAEEAVESAERDLNSAISRIDDREDKLVAKERELRQEGLTDEERRQIRDRIEEVRGEIRDARRDAWTARETLEWARREADRVRYDLSSRYPV